MALRAVLVRLHIAVREGIGQPGVGDGDVSHMAREAARAGGCKPAEVEDKVDVVRTAAAEVVDNPGMEAHRMELAAGEHAHEMDNTPAVEGQEEEHRSRVAEDRESVLEGEDTRTGVEVNLSKNQQRRDQISLQMQEYHVRLGGGYWLYMISRLCLRNRTNAAYLRRT